MRRALQATGEDGDDKMAAGPLHHVVQLPDAERGLVALALHHAPIGS